MTYLELSAMTRARLDELGSVGEAWRADLDEIVGALCSKWGLNVEGSFMGGSASLVVGTATSDGFESTLKVFIPRGGSGYGEYERELAALRRGGPGYVALLDADEGVRAMLLERLGSPLGNSDLAVEQKIDIIEATLSSAWSDAPNADGFLTGAEQAQGLIAFIEAEAPGSPLERDIAARAIELAGRRCNAFNPSTSVLIHGDGHEMNVLAAHGQPGTYRLIDPEPMVSSREHDLALPLRDWSATVLAGDSVAIGQEWCRRISAPSGADAKAVWEWVRVERVTTGLLMSRLGNPQAGPMLEVARRWILSS